MEQRLANSWRMTVNEKKFIETALLSELRIDGRRPFDYRKLTIKFGSEDGSSEVQLGQTHVMGFVTAQLVQPYRDRPNEGTLSIYTEFSPMADPSFEAGRPGEFAVELGRVIDRGLRESRSVDTESLCIISGKLVWAIRIDIHILDNGGNLVDAANIAALAALSTFRRPECSLGGEDGQEVIVHPAEVESYNTERALRKIRRHPSSIAVDVSGAGPNLGGKQNQLNDQKGGHLLDRLKLSSEGSVADTDAETKSMEPGQTNRRDGVSKNFIGAPSSWDPYSKGVDTDLLKASLASRVMSTQSKIKESRDEKVSNEAKPEQPSENTKPASSSIEAAQTDIQNNEEKTLKDAVKPKNKRKKRASSNDAR